MFHPTSTRHGNASSRPSRLSASLATGESFSAEDLRGLTHQTFTLDDEEEGDVCQTPEESFDSALDTSSVQLTETLGGGRTDVRKVIVHSVHFIVAG